MTTTTPGYLSFPYRIDAGGATATADLSAYTAGLVRLVLQTEPGERVNRPTFGAGLRRLVFEGMDSQMIMAAETLIRGALMQWLADAISIQTLSITVAEGEARVSLTYIVSHTQQVVNQTVQQGLPS